MPLTTGPRRRAGEPASAPRAPPPAPPCKTSGPPRIPTGSAPAWEGEAARTAPHPPPPTFPPPGGGSFKRGGGGGGGGVFYPSVPVRPGRTAPYRTRTASPDCAGPPTCGGGAARLRPALRKRGGGAGAAAAVARGLGCGRIKPPAGNS